MRLFVPFLILTGNSIGRKVTKGTRWHRRQHRIVVRERDNAALGVFTNSNERFGNTFFGDSLFDLDIDEPLVQPIGLRSYNVHMPKKEWTPCIGSEVSTEPSKKKPTRFNQCLEDKNYGVAAIKCINWTRSGNLQKTISKEGLVCKPACEKVLAQYRDYMSNMVTCDEEPTDDLFSRGGKGRKRKGKKSKNSPAKQTFETDGMLMFDDTFVEGTSAPPSSDSLLMFDDTVVEGTTFASSSSESMLMFDDTFVEGTTSAPSPARQHSGGKKKGKGSKGQPFATSGKSKTPANRGPGRPMADSVGEMTGGKPAGKGGKRKGRKHRG